MAQFTSGTTAITLGVPKAWLKREAREGRVPCLRAGRTYLLDAALVGAALQERAKTNEEHQVDDR